MGSLTHREMSEIFPKSSMNRVRILHGLCLFLLIGLIEAGPMYLMVGEKVELECIDNDASDVQWYKDGEAVDTSVNSGFIIMTNKQTKQGHLVTFSQLSKHRVDWSNSGTYECRASPINHLLRVSVLVFNIRGEDVMLDTSKSSLQLWCQVEGLISYQPLKWYRNDKLIDPLDSQYSMDHRNNTLTIKHPDGSNSGPYHCGTTVPDGRNYTHQVNVIGVYITGPAQPVSVGSNVTLQCQAWLGSQDTLVNMTFGNSPGNAMNPQHIQFPSVQMSDSGRYRCSALLYGMGVIETFYTLQVTDPAPRIIAGVTAGLALAVLVVIGVVIFAYCKKRAPISAEKGKR